MNVGVDVDLDLAGGKMETFAVQAFGWTRTTGRKKQMKQIGQLRPGLAALAASPGGWKRAQVERVQQPTGMHAPFSFPPATLACWLAGSLAWQQAHVTDHGGTSTPYRRTKIDEGW